MASTPLDHIDSWITDHKTVKDELKLLYLRPHQINF